MRGRYLVLVACGCNAAFGLDPTQLAEEAILAPCAPDAGLYDDFESDTPCPWGDVAMSGANVRIDRGRLLITPDPNLSETSFGGCKSRDDYAFGPEGVILEVAAALQGDPTYLVLHLYPVEAGALGVTLKQERGRFGIYTGDLPASALVDFDPIAMRWWRMRPEDDASGYIAEFSTDGLDWKFLGTARGQVAQRIWINFGAGTIDPVDQPGTAAFGRIQLCAP